MSEQRSQKGITPAPVPSRFLRFCEWLGSWLPQPLRPPVRAILALILALSRYAVVWLQSRRLRPPPLRRFQPPAAAPRYFIIDGVRHLVNIEVAFTPKSEEVLWIQQRFQETQSPDERLALMRRQIGIFVPTLPRQRIEALDQDQIELVIRGISAWFSRYLVIRRWALERYKEGNY